MEVCDRIAVIDFGEKIAEGPARGDPERPARDPGLPGGGPPMLLELEDVHVHYGKVEALKGISVTVDEGEIVTLIGANGAGKTTTLKTISGVRPVTSGTIRFDGEDITGMAAAPARRAGHLPGPEGRGIFPGMTVLENLEMGAYARKGKDTADDLERVFELFPRLARAPHAGRRHPVGRRAADAGHRPGADGAGRSCCCSTSRRWAWRRSSWRRSSRSSPRSTRRAPRSCWSSRTPPRPCSGPTGPTCSRSGRVVKTDDASALLDDDAVRAAYLGGGAKPPPGPRRAG